MYARVAIVDDVDPRLREETWNWVQSEGQRLERELPGYQGVLTLVDAENRRTLRIHLPESEEHARETDAILQADPSASLPEELRRGTTNGPTPGSARSSSATESDADAVKQYGTNEERS